MSGTAGWAAAYRAYDDATLEALAGAGPVRRAAKDVAAGRVGTAAVGSDDVTIEVDGTPVVLDRAGPAAARCACPAAGTCKHVLAAVMWVRDEVSRTSDEDGVVGPEPVATPPDPLAEVLALDPRALLKEAGAAAVREAAAADDPGLRWEVEGGVLVLGLTALGVTCRWVAGAGFAEMVSDLPGRRRNAVHLLALAALRAEHGAPLPWPGTASVPGTSATDVGPLLDAVDATLHHLLATGLSHLTGSSTERLQAQTVSARTSGLPRLASQLRSVTGTLALIERRDHRADVGDALAALARTHALVAALRATADGTGDPAVRRALEGRLRRDFDEGTELRLLPVGLRTGGPPGAAPAASPCRRGTSTRAGWCRRCSRVPTAATPRSRCRPSWVRVPCGRGRPHPPASSSAAGCSSVPGCPTTVASPWAAAPARGPARSGPRTTRAWRRSGRPTGTPSPTSCAPAPGSPAARPTPSCSVRP